MFGPLLLYALTMIEMDRDALGACLQKPVRKAGKCVSGCNGFAHSQEGEDLQLLHRFFSHDGVPLRDGFYIEMGALNGWYLSNSLLYERCLGWHGLLMEGNPSNFRVLKTLRPTAITLQRAVCAKETIVNFTLSGSAVSGIPELMHDRHKQIFASRHGAGHPTVPVRCGPLAEYFEMLGITHANLFSLDVEGAELVALKSIDWSRFSVDVLMVETDGGNQTKDALVRLELLKAGLTQGVGVVGKLNSVFYNASAGIRDAASRPRSKGAGGKGGGGKAVGVELLKPTTTTTTAAPRRTDTPRSPAVVVVVVSAASLYYYYYYWRFPNVHTSSCGKHEESMFCNALAPLATHFSRSVALRKSPQLDV